MYCYKLALLISGEGDSGGATKVNMRQFILGITAQHNSDPAAAAETLDSALGTSDSRSYDCVDCR